MAIYLKKTIRLLEKTPVIVLSEQNLDEINANVGDWVNITLEKTGYSSDSSIPKNFDEYIERFTNVPREFRTKKEKKKKR